MTQSEASQLVGREQLAPLLEAAAASTRKRSHLLLHADQQDQVQLLSIALEPESYVRPHVHGEQWEMIVLLRGRFYFLILDPQAGAAAAPGDEHRFPGRGHTASGCAQRRGARAGSIRAGQKARPLSAKRIRTMGSRGRPARQRAFVMV